MQLNLLNTKQSHRECGGCTACCTVCAVHELSKPMNQACQHLGERGCTIYETRPTSCRTFYCVWLQGVLPEKHRPDRSGIVWSLEDSPTEIGMTLVQARLLHDQVPMERIEFLFNLIRKAMSGKLVLHILPHTLKVRPLWGYVGHEIKPGVWMIDREATEVESRASGYEALRKHYQVE